MAGKKYLKKKSDIEKTNKGASIKIKGVISEEDTMKKILYIFLMIMMLGCGKETEQKEIVKEKNYKVSQIENEKEKNSSENIENLNFEVTGITTNSNLKPRIEIEFNDDVLEENLDGYIKISPEADYKVLNDKNRIVINGNFKIGDTYKIEILKGLKSRDGKVLKENIIKEAVFREIEPKIVFSNEGIILPVSDNKKIAFKSVNVKKINLKIKKIYENNTTQFLQNFVFKGNGNIFDYNVEGEFYKVGDTVFEKDYEINSEKNIWKQTEIELGNLVDHKGIFIVEISFDENGIDYVFPDGTESWQKYELLRNNGKIGKAILLSSMGIAAQKENDKTVVTVMDIIKNEPVKDVKVKLVTNNNQTAEEGTTDSRGEFVFNKCENIMYVLAERGEEKSILKFSDAELFYDGFAVDGVYADKGIKTFIYTDRGIYRPGDTVYISFIARNDKESFPENHPIKINVYSPRGKKFIENKIINNGKNGFYTYSFKTNQNSETGIWRVEAEIGSEKFVKDISVETIVPYKIKVKTKVPEKINLNENESFAVDIKSDYLFGAPADNLEFNVEFDVREKEINFKKYKNYVFKNPTTYNYHYRDYKEGTLNEKGEGKAEFNISKIAPQNINLTGIITAKVIETGGRPVIKKDLVSLNKFDTYVGIKIPEVRYIKSGDRLNLEVIAVSEDENLISGRKLVYRVYKNEYSWWWDYDSYNSFARSIKTDRNTVLLYEKEFISGEKPYIIDYAPDGSGEIFVEVEDLETKQSTGINLYASTWQDSSINSKIDKLKIETDKKSYRAEDTAKITFEGTKGAKALVTVEKSGEIIERKWIPAENLKNIYEIKVTENMFPNCYINIGLFQDYNTLDNDRPLRLYGAVPVIVEDDSTKLNIKIDAPKEIKPNEKFVVKIKNTEEKKMNYTVAVVDVGLLDITGFDTPDPWNYFYQKEAMQVRFYDNYSEIMGRITGEVHQILKTGGDGFVNEMAVMKSLGRMKELGLEEAQRFKPVAMFKGVLETDEKGEGTAEFTMPNYMGAVKVMAVGADGEKYGSSDTEILVKAPVVMENSFLRTLKVGDEIEIPVKVFALEDNIGEIKIDFDFMGRKQEKIISLDKKGNETVFFREKIGNETGVKKIKISISSKEYSYEEEIETDVNSNNPYLYFNKKEIVDSGKEFSVKQPEDYIKGSVKGNISVSVYPIISADKRLAELIRYPYGCGEQTVSAVFPQIYIEMLTHNNKFSSKEITGNVNSAIAKLSENQLYDGSFPYWQGGDTDIWVTDYTGHFLTEAKERGYYVPEDMYKRVLSFMKKMVRDSEANLSEKVYGLYILALGENPEVSQMNLIYENYFEKLNLTSKWYLAAAYKLIGEDKLAEEIAGKLSLEVPEPDEEYLRYSYGSPLREQAVILNCYYTIFGKADEKLYKKIVKKIESNEWLSTQSMGYSLMTLAKMKNSESEKEAEGIIITDDKQISFKTEKGVYSSEIPAEIKTVKVKTKENENLFVNYYWEGIPVNYEGENVSENLKLERNYYDIHGNIIDPESILSGDTFWLEVKLSAEDDVKGYIFVNDVAVTQILPTGWEMENIRAVGGEYPEWVQDRMNGTYVEYEDIRDDRVMWFCDFDNYNKKAKSFFVKINGVTKGSFDFPGTKAEAMYNNSYQAYLKGFKAEVK